MLSNLAGIDVKEIAIGMSGFLRVTPIPSLHFDFASIFLAGQHMCLRVFG